MSNQQDSQPAIVSKDTQSIINAIRTFDDGIEMFLDAITEIVSENYVDYIMCDFAEGYENARNIMLKHLMDSINNNMLNRRVEKDYNQI